MPTDLTHDQMVKRVEKLLAKAQSTDFEAEADAFIAKAQSLITQHKIDQSKLNVNGQASTPNVEAICKTIRIKPSMKYRERMILVMSVLADANEVYVIFSKEGSETGRMNIWMLYGTQSSIDSTMRLWRAVYPQVKRGLKKPPPEGVHGRRFRTSYITGFAHALGARLQKARKEAVGSSTDLVVLHDEMDRAKDRAADDWPHMRTQKMNAGTSSDGYGQGMKDGRSANLATGKIRQQKELV